MARNQLLCMGVAGLVAAGAAGCGDKTDKMSMGHDGKVPAPPARPAELDKLNDLVGNWTFTGTCTMPGGETKTMTGASNATWECGRWCVMEKVEGPSMMGSGMFSGMNVTTYDTREGKFKTAWMDSEGRVNHGTMWQDGPRMWKTKGLSMNTVTGEKCTGDGWMKMVDSNTMEWGGTEYSNGKKMMEMKGTSRRKM